VAVPTLSRRRLLGGLAALGLAATLPACSPRTATTADGPVRFTFWGPDFYQQFTRQMVDGFTTAHPDIPVSTEPAEWSGYWDRLATQVAASDEPDVINMDGKYLAEYAGRGALADLEKLPGLDLSGIAASDLDAGRVDGVLHAVSTGQNAWVIMANPDLFAKAGVKLPDDTSWTWADFSRIAAEISASGVATGFSGGGRMSSLLGCRLNHRIASIAPVGGLRWTGPCPGRAVPVLTVHGLADTTNPYEGHGDRGAEWVESVPEALAGWASHNRCQPKLVQEDMPGPAHTVRYTGCASGAEVRLLRIDGMGHVWPRAEIDATAAIWQFFKTHPLQ
jgi:hypothetical protein